jgi:hypothetical protein
MGASHISKETVTSSSRKATARRVNLALSIYSGRKRPTLKMLARLVGLSPQCLYQARFRRKHNGRKRGAQGIPNGNGHQPKLPSLAERLAHASSEKRVAALRTIGVDHMVGWLCEAERTSAAAK